MGPSEIKSAGGQAYLLFGVSLVLVATLGTALQIVSVAMGLVITELVLILLPAVVFVRWKKLPYAQALGWRQTSSATFLLSLTVGVTGWGVAAAMHEWISRPLLGQPPETPGLSPQTFPHLLLLLFCAALLPGLCEESLFRGVLQGILRRRGSLKAVLYTALLFGVFHLNPWVLLPAFFLGLVFGTLAERTGSSLPAILAHFANNATSLTVAYLFRDQTDSAAYVPMAWLAAGFLLAFPAFWMYSRANQARLPLLATVPAGLSRPYLWVGGLSAAAVLLLVVAIVTAGMTMIDIQTVSSDALSPEILKGQRVILLKGRGILPLDLEVGDTVLAEFSDKPVLFRITRIEGNRLWLFDGGSQQEVERSAITAKVVHTLGPSSR